MGGDRSQSLASLNHLPVPVPYLMISRKNFASGLCLSGPVHQRESSRVCHLDSGNSVRKSRGAIIHQRLKSRAKRVSLVGAGRGRHIAAKCAADGHERIGGGARRQPGGIRRRYCPLREGARPHTGVARERHKRRRRRPGCRLGDDQRGTPLRQLASAAPAAQPTRRRRSCFVQNGFLVVRAGPESAGRGRPDLGAAGPAAACSSARWRAGADRRRGRIPQKRLVAPGEISTQRGVEHAWVVGATTTGRRRGMWLRDEWRRRDCIRPRRPKSGRPLGQADDQRRLDACVPSASSQRDREGSPVMAGSGAPTDPTVARGWCGEGFHVLASHRHDVFTRSGITSGLPHGLSDGF